MKLLYIHQYFQTPNDPGGTRSYWISKEFVSRGHKVTMLTTSANFESNIERVNVDGIDVIYLKVPYSQSMSIFSRLVSFISFMLKATWVALKEKDVDFIVATSTPLTIGFPALVVNKLKKIPFLFEVRDLWPEVPIQMGGLNNKLIIKVALWFEKTIYKNAKHVVALSPGMREGILQRDISPAKVTMIPNMSKVDVFGVRVKKLELYEKYGLRSDTFKIVYFGAMGIANGMDYIVDGVRHLGYMDSVEFVFVGGGAKESELKRRCSELNMPNIHFLGKMGLEELSSVVNLCDVSLVTFADIPILATNSPNKLFDSLSAGKPIIVNSPGWTKDLVEKNKCGMFVSPKNSKDLAVAIRYLYDNPLVCVEMGNNSRKLAETSYDKSILCAKFVHLVEDINGCNTNKEVCATSR